MPTSVSPTARGCNAALGASGPPSRPPADHLTRLQAEARLAAILAGREPGVNVAPTRCTFGRACDDWLSYIEHDRKRRPSTVGGYRRTVRCYLHPAFGEDTPIEEITVADVDAYRARLVAERRLSDRTINKSLVLLHGIFKRAQRVHGLTGNPAAGAERQPYRRSGDFQVLDSGEVAQLAACADNIQDAAIFTVAAFTGLRLGELWRCAGGTWISPGASSTSAAATSPAGRTPRSPARSARSRSSTRAPGHWTSSAGASTLPPTITACSSTK